MGRLDGKTALVTGASRGIGRAIAVELAREGARVALNYQSSDARAQEVLDEINEIVAGRAHELGAVSDSDQSCILARSNVADPKEAREMVKRVVDKFGRLDVLVNNAGITRDKSLRKMTDEDWLEVVQTNLNAVFFCTSAATATAPRWACSLRTGRSLATSWPSRPMLSSACCPAAEAA